MGEKFDKSSQDSKPKGTELHKSEKPRNPEQSGVDQKLVMLSL